MSRGAPRLPLTPSQVAALLGAVQRAARAEREGRLPPIPERVLVELVRVLRAERAADGGPPTVREARRRMRRAAAVTGLAGLPGRVSAEAIALVEQARAAVALAERRGVARDDAELAADLLVVWDLVDDRARAEAITAGTAGRSLLDHEVAVGTDRLRDELPDEWTPWSTLRFLWRLRRLRDAVPDALQPGVRSLPIVGAVPAALGAGREMKAFQKRLGRHLDAIAADARRSGA